MNNEMSELLPFLIPIFILQAILMITALIMIIRQSTFNYLNKFAWIIVVVLFNIVGPILYFVLERR